MNQTELEERLRAAYRARAEAVTERSRTPELPDLVRPLHHGRRSVLAPLLAAAAVVLLAVGALVVAHFANHRSQPSDQRLRFTTPELTRWGGIRPGWTVALWAPNRGAEVDTVFLVSPTGERHRVTSIDVGKLGYLAAVSRDNSRAAFLAPPNSAHAPTTVITLDLRTHRQDRFTIPPAGQYAGFATSDGTLHAIDVDNRVKLVDATGVVEGEHDATALERAMEGSAGSSMATTINGRTVIISTASRIVINTEAGDVLASLKLPGRGCNTLRPWSETALLVSCSGGLWSVPLDGGPAALLARRGADVQVGQGAPSAPYYLLDVVRVSGQLYGLEAPSCGANTAIARIGVDKRPRRVSSAEVDGLPVSGAIAGHTDDSFYYVAVSGCRGREGTLYRYAPARGTVTPLLGSGAGGGVVRSAATIEPLAPGDWLPTP